MSSLSLGVGVTSRSGVKVTWQSEVLGCFESFDQMVHILQIQERNSTFRLCTLTSDYMDMVLASLEF